MTTILIKHTILTQAKQILTISSKHCIVPSDASTMMRERECTRACALALSKGKNYNKILKGKEKATVTIITLLKELKTCVG